MYRCAACSCRFVIEVERGLSNRGGKGITCPLCAEKKCKELDATKEIGGEVVAAATKLFDWWKNR